MVYRRNDKSISVREKKIRIPQIEFIIKDGIFMYIEFKSEKLSLNKYINGINDSLTFPISYGILKRKVNKKYRKGIIKGSNKIRLKDKRMFNELHIKRNYKWEWERKIKNLKESHIADIELRINRKK
jgi:hypothetical protein